MAHPTSYPPSPDVSRAGDLQRLSEQLTELAGVLHRLKAQVLSVGGPDRARQKAAHVLLFPLCAAGPLRQGELADLVHADPSTVSRHVAVLVEQGLVSRVADEHDGRATRLVVTPAGKDVLRTMRQEREVLLGRVLGRWTDEDLASFTRLLHRFAGDLGDQVPLLTADSGTPTPHGDTPVTHGDTPVTSEKDR